MGSTIYLVSCVSEKRTSQCAARDLYTSDWFTKARAYVEDEIARAGGNWFILSAEHGLLAPEARVAPYNRTLNDMPVAERREWARKVLIKLLPELEGVARVVVLAGERYREFLLPTLDSLMNKVEVPLKGLAIGEQLAALKKATSRAAPGSRGSHLQAAPAANKPPVTGPALPNGRATDLERFYGILGELRAKLGLQTLFDASGRMNWPKRGVYFFFEESQRRESGNGQLRVIRVGTHALKAGSGTTLWDRLSQCRGTNGGGGNHRGSIFRLLLGEALLKRSGLTIPTWGIGGTASDAGERDVVLQAEAATESSVSDVIRAMPLLWVDVPDEAGPASARGVIERNAIALLSNYSRQPIDPASPTWLGLDSERDLVRTSGLWNNNYVTENYDAPFLDLLQEAAARTTPP